MNSLTRLITAVVAGATLALPLSGMTAPDEAQRQMIQRAQDAKKKLGAAQAAQGAERQRMMQEHMKMMQDMMAQMQKAKPGSDLSAEKMREWIDEHMKLMNEMMGQMMSEHHMMMQGMAGMGGMGKK